MRLDGDAQTLQLPKIIPITDGFFRLFSCVKIVDPSDVVGRDKENGRVSESEQPGKGDGTDRAVSVIEGEQDRPFGQVLRSRDAPEQCREVDHPPAMFAQVAQVPREYLFRYVEPRSPATRGGLADLVVAEDGEAPTGRSPSHANARSSTRPTTFWASKCSSASSRASRQCRS